MLAKHVVQTTGQAPHIQLRYSQGAEDFVLQIEPVLTANERPSVLIERNVE